MKLRAAILVSMVPFLVAAVGLWQWVSPALAGGDPAASAFYGQESDADEGPTYAYVGSKKCKKCHLKQYKSLEATKMGKAFDILKPGQRKEKKEQFKLDVDKDYTQDKTCIKCHTTGFGHEGGYAIPDPSDKKAVYLAKNLESVGCEMCHGPGSEYIKVFDEILKSKRKYKVEELYKVGLRKVDEAMCKTCHNEESPSINPGDSFDYEEKKDEGTHEHIALKQRHE